MTSKQFTLLSKVQPVRLQLITLVLLSLLGSLLFLTKNGWRIRLQISEYLPGTVPMAELYRIWGYNHINIIIYICLLILSYQFLTLCAPRADYFSLFSQITPSSWLASPSQPSVPDETVSAPPEGWGRWAPPASPLENPTKINPEVVLQIICVFRSQLVSCTQHSRWVGSLSSMAPQKQYLIPSSKPLSPLPGYCLLHRLLERKHRWWHLRPLCTSRCPAQTCWHAPTLSPVLYQKGTKKKLPGNNKRLQLLESTWDLP